MEDQHCTFCSIIVGDLPCVEIYRDAQILVIMDKYPISSGHTLIIPMKHYAGLLDMPQNEVCSLYFAVPAIARAVISAVHADGFNIMVLLLIRLFLTYIST